jgi:hypothetical protein
MLVHVGRVVMIVKNWIILGVAVSAILVYTVGIPPSFSAEYSKSAQYTQIQGDENTGALSSTQR